MAKKSKKIVMSNIQDAIDFLKKNGANEVLIKPVNGVLTASGKVNGNDAIIHIENGQSK